MMLSFFVVLLTAQSVCGFAPSIASASIPRRSMIMYDAGDQRDQRGQEVPDIKNRERKLFYSQKTFQALGLTPQMVEVLASLDISQPSKIQALSFFGINSGKPCILADQTGSGKTLAYLLPSLQRLVAARAERNKAQSKEEAKSPFMVVLTPTTELAVQVSKVVKTLANALKFRTACFTSGSDLDAERKKLRLGTDVLVATPGRLLQLVERKEIDLSELNVMVLDEADVLLMDESFPLQPIGQACSPSTQFVFTTATLPELVTEQIKTEFPEVMLLSGPGLHRIAPNVQEFLVDCSGPREQARSRDQVDENKRAALLKALDRAEAQRTVVFCNTIDQCRRVENILQRDDRRDKMRSVHSYHGAVDAATRDANLIEFSRPLLTKPAILISTDRASRGMDFNKAHVDHVILFDFPAEPSEYLRRVGRTGRAGREGMATILAYGRQVAVAKTVMRASIEGKKIEPGGG